MADRTVWAPTQLVRTRHRTDNHYPGCTCPPWRYCPWLTRPTNPQCQEHGEP